MTEVEPDAGTGGATGTPPSDLVPRRAWHGLAVAAVSTVLVGFNGTATNIAFGDIARDFSSSSATTVSWIASGYFIATGALLPLGGRLADRLGRRRVFLAGLVLFVVSAVASALAPTVLSLIAARVLQAAAGAMVLPASLALVLPSFPEGKRSTAIGLWSAAGPLGAAITPTLAAEIIDALDWRWVYFVTAPVAAATLVAGLRLLDESDVEPGQGRLDLWGAALGTAGIGLVVAAITQSVDWGWVGALALGGVGVAVSVLFVRQSMRHPEPLVNLRLLRIRDVLVANLANAFVSVVSLSVWLVWPLYLANVWGYSTSGVGRGLTVGPVVAGLSTVVFSRLSDRFGQRPFVRLGTLLMLGSTLWGAFVLRTEVSYWTTFAPALALFGLGWGMATPLLNSMALSAVDERFYGETNGMFNTMRYGSAAVGTAGAIAILGDENRPDIAAAYDRTFLFFAVWCLLAAVVVFAIPHGRPGDGASVGSGPP